MGVAANPTLFSPDYGTKPVTLLKGPVVSAISLVNKGANKKRFFLFKSEDGPVDTRGFYCDEHGDLFDRDDFNKTLPLIKAGPTDDAWSAVYCVVAVPGEVDAQKDVWDEETIRQSAHEYLKKSRLVNYMHKDLDAVGDLVQSAIAPTDMKVGEEYIPKGSWFIAIEPNPEMKKMIEAGEVTGVSVQGSSKREELASHHLMHLDLAKGNYDSAVVPRAVTQMDYEIPESKEDMEVPDNTEGPGIVMLQHVLGIPETGKFDKLTKKAVTEWMKNKGVPGKPTLATVKLILIEGEQSVEEAPAQAQAQPTGQEPPSAAQSTGQVQEEAPDGAGQEEAMKLLKARGQIYHYIGDSSKTPLWVKELGKKDVIVEFPPGKDPNEKAETAKVDLGELEKCNCDDPDSHYSPLLKDHPTQTSSFGGGSFNPADSGVRFPGEGSSRSGEFDSQSYGTHPENKGTQASQMSPDSSDDELKAVLIRAISSGNELLMKHLVNQYSLSSAEQIYTYPFTIDELWGLVSRYVLGRMDNPPSHSMMMQPVRRTDRSVYPEGSGFSMQKVSPFDIHTPTASLPDKNGMELGVGASVKLKGGEIAVISAVDVEAQELHVETLPLDGDVKVRIVKAKSVELAEPEPHFETPISSDMANFGGVLLKGVWSGSHGGHDPEAQGKIKYIVRSFGSWARGKQSVAAKKLLERGVVKTPEAANRLAAWLKDQWAGSTKWRGDDERKKVGKSTFAESYDEYLLKELDDDCLEKAFHAACEEVGHDPHEVAHMISEEHHDFDGILDKLFEETEEESQELSEDDLEVAKSFISIMREEGDTIQKLLEVEQLLNKSQPNPRTPNNEDFMAAMTALQLGIADAVSNEDLEKREGDLDAVLVDFGGWLHKFVEGGCYFDYESELNKSKLCKCGLKKAECTCEDSKEAAAKKLLENKPKSIEVANMEKMENLKGATVADAEGNNWIVVAHDGETLSVMAGKERKQVPVSAVKVVKQPMGKAYDEEGGEFPPKKKLRLPVNAAPAERAPEGAPAGGPPEERAGAPEGAEGEGEGAGNRLARLLAAARKKKAAMAAEAPQEEQMMTKSAAPLTSAKIDRLRETRKFLESVLNYEDEAPAEAPEVMDTPEEATSNVEAPVAEAAEADFDNTEVEKDVDASTEATEETMSDSDINMDQIVEAINGLGEEVDSILARVEGFDTLGSKLDHISDLAKSFDSTERMDVLEQAVERLTEALGVFTETAESVETLTKRLTALEGQPGSSTAVPVDVVDHLIAKSDTSEKPLFQRTWGSIF